MCDGKDAYSSTAVATQGAPVTAHRSASASLSAVESVAGSSRTAKCHCTYLCRVTQKCLSQMLCMCAGGHARACRILAGAKAWHLPSCARSHGEISPQKIVLRVRGGGGRREGVRGGGGEGGEGYLDRDGRLLLAHSHQLHPHLMNPHGLGEHVRGGQQRACPRQSAAAHAS